MYRIVLLLVFCTSAFLSGAQQPAVASELSHLVSFDDYLELTLTVKEYRKDRVITWAAFDSLSRLPNVIILDTRSDSMYAAKHLAGAVHLDFSDFTQERLSEVIPSASTTILIYCNNNFLEDRISQLPDRYFMSKGSRPDFYEDLRPRTLALNIPTFINLYGYGYRNIYELGELVFTNDPKIRFEGSNAE